MIKKLIKKRRFKGEEYLFYLNAPEYEGEKGCLGIEIEPYISVQTPENAFGYTDTVLFNTNGSAYTLYRYLPRWILKECEKVHEQIMKKTEKENTK